MIEKKEWSKWWGKAKKALLRDPNVKIGKGSSPLLELRDEAKTIEQEVAEKMQAVAAGTGKVAVAREYLRTLDLTPELAQAVGKVVEEALANETEPGPSRLALLYLKTDLKGDGAEAAAEEAQKTLLDAEDLVTLLAPMEVADRKRAIAEIIEQDMPGWPELVTAVLRAGDADVADAAHEQLRKVRPDILIGFFSQLSANPAGNPSL